MRPTVYFVVNIDSDPDPEDTPRNDDAVMEKYRLTQALVKERVGGAASICVHTSPMYRDRFFEPRFMDFWREWTEAGGDLILHPEEDLYATPETRLNGSTRYLDTAHMEAVITEKVASMKDRGLTFAAYKGGAHGLTIDIAYILERAGIPVDVSCAPGLDWPERAARWANAPRTAYYMSTRACDEEAGSRTQSILFEIPLGWDGATPDATKRRQRSKHYLANESSRYEDLCQVWDSIVEQAERSGSPQFVSMLCHTYAIATGRFYTQLSRILDYMRTTYGTPVTASEARARYDVTR